MGSVEWDRWAFNEEGEGMGVGEGLVIVGE